MRLLDTIHYFVISNSSQQKKGRQLENLIIARLRKYGKVYHSVYLPLYNGGYTEVDVILVTKKWIYVIEAKNYSGYIYGNTASQKWMQILGKTRNQFFNPLKQNKIHEEVLSKQLDIPLDYLAPVVIFGDNCKPKIDGDMYKQVTTVAECDALIQYFESYNIPARINQNEIASILKPCTKLSCTEKLAHIKRVKDIKKSK